MSACGSPMGPRRRLDRLLDERERIRATQLAEFQAELDRRVAALERGEHVDPAAVRADLRARSQSRRASRR